MTEGFVSLRCVFFSFSFVIGSFSSGCSCLLEVGASYADETVVEYGSRKNHQVLSAHCKTEKRKTESSISSKHYGCSSLNTMVLSFSESTVVVSFFPYFLIYLSPMDQ